MVRRSWYCRTRVNQHVSAVLFSRPGQQVLAPGFSETTIGFRRHCQCLSHDPTQPKEAVCTVPNMAKRVAKKNPFVRLSVPTGQAESALSCHLGRRGGRSSSGEGGEARIPGLLLAMRQWYPPGPGPFCALTHRRGSRFQPKRRPISPLADPASGSRGKSAQGGCQANNSV